MSVSDTIQLEKNSMEKYIRGKTDTLSQLARSGTKGITTQTKEDMWIQHTQSWHSKKLHGQFPKTVEENDSRRSWKWLQCDIKGETEGLITAAQDQCLSTNNYRRNILHDNINSKCRLCNQAEETINHIVSECPNLAKKKYMERHNNVARVVHWEICKQFGIPTSQQWYRHRPEDQKVTENTKAKILWDFNIQTDNVITHRRPDIVVINKQKKETIIIDVAVPADIRVEKKEVEKIEKYTDLKVELQRVWRTKVKIVPVVIGALGTVSKRHHKHLQAAEIGNTERRLQKATILGTAHILRRVLDTSACE